MSKLSLPDCLDLPRKTRIYPSKLEFWALRAETSKIKKILRMNVQNFQKIAREQIKSVKTNVCIDLD